MVGGVFSRVLVHGLRPDIIVRLFGLNREDMTWCRGKDVKLHRLKAGRA